MTETVKLSLNFAPTAVLRFSPSPTAPGTFTQACSRFLFTVTLSVNS